MNTNYTKEKYVTIFSLRVRKELRKRGFEPLVEIDNFLKPGFKCWKYINSAELQSVLPEILMGGDF
jgi:hypothetical protein